MDVEERLNEIAWRARKHMIGLKRLDDVTGHEKLCGQCHDAGIEVLRLSKQPKFEDLEGKFKTYILIFEGPLHKYHTIVVYEAGKEHSYVIDVTKAQFPELHANTGCNYVVPYWNYPWALVNSYTEDTERYFSLGSSLDPWSLRRLLTQLIEDVQEKLVEGIENGTLKPRTTGEENKKGHLYEFNERI